MKHKNIKLTGGGLKGEDLFEKIICPENLFSAWKEFIKGKRRKIDVQKFQSNLNNNILKLHGELKDKNYQHSNYFSFCVKDPKLRHIHKACVKDRVLHHAVFRILYPISQDILMNLIKRKIKDENAIWLIDKIIKSFPKGLPLGNITSQLFANVYLNELDRFIKHKLKIEYYIRYCDDFVILDASKSYLESLISKIDNFLQNDLKLFLHPEKVTIKRYGQGIDFLGYVSFPYHRILRTKTRKRMIRNIGRKASEKSFDQTLQSYLGTLKHCNSYKLKKEILEFIGERY